MMRCCGNKASRSAKAHDGSRSSQEDKGPCVEDIVGKDKPLWWWYAGILVNAGKEAMKGWVTAKVLSASDDEGRPYQRETLKALTLGVPAGWNKPANE